ncbi:MAG TPA: patatin-like phospholipase family protein [Candidatus Dormibacteraeota bacterium]|nr:patatin-like phospholipase family protein [Candidatus Dormibacteraeota bacterium]
MRRLTMRGRRRDQPAAWVLSGGGARGAAQVGVIQALLERGIAPTTAVFGTSVGALDGAVISAWPNLEGAELLQQLWRSRPAAEVFRVHSLGALRSRLAGQLGIPSPGPVQALIDRFELATGCGSFEDLQVPLRVVATDLRAGCPVVFRSGPLAPPLMASAAIPGVFPPVEVGDHICCDGGIVDNAPISIAVEEGYGTILAIGLMAGGELSSAPSSWTELIARSLQLSLHQRLLSDFHRLRGRARIVVICPITSPRSAWDMRPAHVQSLIARSRDAVLDLLADEGGALFGRSAIYYLDVGGEADRRSRATWLAEAV